MKAQDLVSKWKDVGEPISGELDTNTQTDFAKKAYNIFIGEVYDYKLRTLQTVSGTVEYTLPSSNIKNVLYTFPSLQGAGVGEISTVVDAGESYAIFAAYGASGVSLWTDIHLMQEISELKTNLQIFLKKETIRLISGALRVIPSPSSAHYINYITQEQFAWDDIPTRLEPVMDDLYCWQQLQYLATKRMAISGVTVGGSLVNYPGDKLLKLAKEYETSALNKIESEQGRLVLFLP